MIEPMGELLTKDEKKAVRQEEWREKADKERKSQLYKTISYWAFGVLIVILGIWALIAFSQGTTTTTTASIKLPAVTSKDFQSNPGGKVTLVEYADFECPACKAYYPLIKQLQAQYGNNLHVVYRMFPLKTIHPNAVSSGKAAYAASLQGKFWEMHDKLFDTQDSWAGLSDPESTFISYAKGLGLNTDTFTKDYESSAADTLMNTSYDQATNIGLNATPTFFLQGQKIADPSSFNDFQSLINAALKK